MAEPEPVDLERIKNKILRMAAESTGTEEFFSLSSVLIGDDLPIVMDELQAARDKIERLRDSLQTVRRLCKNPTDGYGTRCKEAIRQVERSLAEAAKGGE